MMSEMESNAPDKRCAPEIENLPSYATLEVLDFEHITAIVPLELGATDERLDFGISPTRDIGACREISAVTPIGVCESGHSFTFRTSFCSLEVF